MPALWLGMSDDGQMLRVSLEAAAKSCGLGVTQFRSLFGRSDLRRRHRLGPFVTGASRRRSIAMATERSCPTDWGRRARYFGSLLPKRVHTRSHPCH
jgi:hypothetical protein